MRFIFIGILFFILTLVFSNNVTLPCDLLFLVISAVIMSIGVVKELIY